MSIIIIINNNISTLKKNGGLHWIKKKNLTKFSETPFKYSCLPLSKVSNTRDRPQKKKQVIVPKCKISNVGNLDMPNR